MARVGLNAAARSESDRISDAMICGVSRLGLFWVTSETALRNGRDRTILTRHVTLTGLRPSCLPECYQGICYHFLRSVDKINMALLPHISNLPSRFLSV
jgi:hypothetical protein